MADLQTKIRGEEVISCRLGNLNEETKYALNYFKVEEPKLIEKVDEGQRVIFFPFLFFLSIIYFELFLKFPLILLY